MSTCFRSWRKRKMFSISTECKLGVYCVCIEDWSKEFLETSSAQEVWWLQRRDIADLLLVAVPQIQSLSYFQISTFHSRQEWDASQLPLTSVPHPLPYTHLPPPLLPPLTPSPIPQTHLLAPHPPVYPQSSCHPSSTRTHLRSPSHVYTVTSPMWLHDALISADQHTSSTLL